MPLGQLRGFTVGVTADRRHEEQAELLVRLGAKVVHAPAVRTLPLAHDDGVATATRELIDNPPDVVVATTGVGMRGWVAAAESLGLDGALLDALRDARVLARGPKAAGAAVAAGLHVTWRAQSEQAEEVLSHLSERSLRGVRIAVQRDGAPVPHLASALRGHGADVVDVPVYAWMAPDDPSQLVRLITAAAAGRIDAITFTSPPAVWNTFDLADGAGMGRDLREALRARVTVACVGPVTARNVYEQGVDPVVQPQRGRLGAMVAALASAMSDRRLSLALCGRPAVLQGALLAGPTGEVLLTDRERALLAQLSEKPGTVVSKDRLLREVWLGEGADTHAVETAVGRLRLRLAEVGGAIETVPRRGYRLVP